MSPSAGVVHHNHARNGDTAKDVEGKNALVCLGLTVHCNKCVKLFIQLSDSLRTLVYEIGDRDVGIPELVVSPISQVRVRVADSDAGCSEPHTEFPWA